MQQGMQSSIQVKVDFENNNQPIIRITKKESPHIVDELLHRFIEMLGHRSGWLSIKLVSAGSKPTDRYKVYDISPVTPGTDMSIQHSLMGALLQEHLASPDAKSTRSLPSDKGEFTSKFKIGADVQFASTTNIRKAYDKNRKKAPLKKGEIEVVVEPEYYYGTVVAVRFTEAKVYYDCMDSSGNIVYELIPSDFVKSMEKSK